MSKAEPHFGCDQEPEFDEEYKATNMPFHSTNGVVSLGGQECTFTNVICLDDEEKVCVRQYRNGLLQVNNRFHSYESYKEWLEYENRLHKAFQEWMDEYEKNKAKIVKL